LQLALHLLRFLHGGFKISFHRGQVISFDNELQGLKRKPDENGNHR
jgi:hypothetical protein